MIRLIRRILTLTSKLNFGRRPEGVKHRLEVPKVSPKQERTQTPTIVIPDDKTMIIDSRKKEAKTEDLNRLDHRAPIALDFLQEIITTLAEAIMGELIIALPAKRSRSQSCLMKKPNDCSKNTKVVYCLFISNSLLTI